MRIRSTVPAAEELETIKNYLSCGESQSCGKDAYLRHPARMLKKNF
jgi:hypothetical protein